jgi:hypothetical protein
MKTSLPQDRMYAFLGLNQDLDIEIEPDYRYSGHEALACTAKAIIQDLGDWTFSNTYAARETEMETGHLSGDHPLGRQISRLRSMLPRSRDCRLVSRKARAVLITLTSDSAI